MSAFVSYSHLDRPLARRLCKVLSDFDLTHWWDDKLALSTPWSVELEDQLTRATAIVVVWTPNSSGSHWVRREAQVGVDGCKLVQLRFVGAKPPAPFSELQAAEVTNWEENTFPRGIRKALNEIARLQSRDGVLPEYPFLHGLLISEEKVSQFVHEKKHQKSHFPKLDGTLYKDIWEMLMNGKIKLYDELRPGSRQNLDEETYYELLEYLSDAVGR